MKIGENFRKKGCSESNGVLEQVQEFILRIQCLIISIALVFISPFFQAVHAQDGGSGLIPVAVFPIIGEEFRETRRLNGFLMNAVREAGPFDPVAVPHTPIYPDLPPERAIAGNIPYALTGALFPDAGKIHVQLWLYNMEKEELIFTEEMFYTDPDEAANYLNSLTAWVLSKIEIPAAPAIPLSEEEAPEETASEEAEAEPEETEAAAEEAAAEPEETEAAVEETEAVQAEGGMKDSSEGPQFDRHWLYLGFKGGGSLRLYNPHDEPVFGEKSKKNAAFEAGLQVSTEFLEFGKFFSLGLQTEILFTRDAAAFFVISAGDEEFEYMQMLFPLLIKFNVHHGRFVISPYGGIYYPLPLTEMKLRLNGTEESFVYSYSLALGYMGGINLGTMLGPGRLFLDARYAADLSKIRDTVAKVDLFTRNMITLSLGYELGIGKK
ncbi:MAG: hypothetical protein LBR96_07615 [Treponema sp.]|jgi:hypothetical protein|nr:hypothetical protein [Treponema sp.]